MWTNKLMQTKGDTKVDKLINFMAVIGGTVCISLFLLGFMVLSALGEDKQDYDEF